MAPLTPPTPPTTSLANAAPASRLNLHRATKLRTRLASISGTRGTLALPYAVVLPYRNVLPVILVHGLLALVVLLVIELC